MAKLVYSKIFIDGSPILVGSNYSIQLVQKMAEHHRLVITCPTEAIESETGEFASAAKNFVGASIAIQVGTGPSYGVIDNPELQFVGIVTNISIQQRDATGGDLQITAYSPTIILSHGKDSQSFEKKTLEDIIKKATEEYPSDVVPFEFGPSFTEAIPYTVQYKESDFDFIRRLAARYGEWFFYDGENIQFGKLSSENTELIYGQNLETFNFTMQARPQDHQFLAYDSKKGEVHDVAVSDHAESVGDPYVTHVADMSKKVFGKTPLSIYNHSLLDNGKAELDFVAKQKAGKALNTVLFNGQSEAPTIQVGSSTTVKGLESIGGKAYGSYIVTEVVHSVDTTGEYTNQFVGVPLDITVPSYFHEDAVPRCEEQFAIVKDNNDPEGLSRIRVQFPWQVPTNELSPWLRVITPYAGDGKGLHFLPEIDEEALIGFEAGNAEKPFCLGAMYHGQGKSGHGGDGNHIKSIQTRSGHIIALNDVEGGESITITDKNGNSISIDTVENSMSIKALDTITMSATHINLVAAATVNVNAVADYNLNTANKTENVSLNTSLRTKNLTHSVSEEMSSTAKNISNTAKDSINSKAKDKILISAKNKLDQRGGKIDINAKKGKMRVKAKSNVELKGKQVKSN